MPSELVTRIKNATDQNKIWVSCMGEYPADKEAIGSFEYFPNDGGFPAMYFPYKNQKGSAMKTGLKMGLGGPVATSFFPIALSPRNNMI